MISPIDRNVMIHSQAPTCLPLYNRVSSYVLNHLHDSTLPSLSLSPFLPPPPSIVLFSPLPPSLPPSLPLTPSHSPYLGTYTNSQGVAVIRRRIADFITKRDGTATPSNPNNIYLLNGVTDGIKAIMFACVDPREACGVVIPIPQYPIYTASITEFGAKAVSWNNFYHSPWLLSCLISHHLTCLVIFFVSSPLYLPLLYSLPPFSLYPLSLPLPSPAPHPFPSQIEYYLNEKQDWAVDVADMRKRVQSARRHCQPRILVVVNPGNPTGERGRKERWGGGRESRRGRGRERKQERDKRTEKDS